MSATGVAPDDNADPHQAGHESSSPDADQGKAGNYRGGPAPKRIIVGYGFWIFLLSDFIMFAGFFAAYAALSGNTAAGPSGKDLFELKMVAIQTAVLLLSSFTCGMAGVATIVRHFWLTQLGLLVTGLLGATFLYLEVSEFAHLIAEGAGPSRSAFLSSFFSLVGLHGVHVTVGLLWLGTMMAQLLAKGFRDDILRRLLCFSLFWHALDIIWVGLFTVVYLFGMF